VLRLPILWLFLGPPLFRTPGSRGAASSLNASFDVWNIISVGWWLFFGVFAVLEIYRLRAYLPRFLRSLGLLPLLVSAWLLSIFASSLVSPYPMFTLANSVLMTILVVTALDLSLKLACGLFTLARVLHLCLQFSLGLLVLVGLMLLLSPTMVSVRAPFGLRVIGGAIADVSTLAVVTLLLSVFFVHRSHGIARIGYLIVALLGSCFILLAQTRTGYVALVIGLFFFMAQWLITSQQDRREVQLGLACLGIAAVLGVAIFANITQQTQVYRSVWDYLIRDPQSLGSLSGRDGIATVVVREVSARPLGLGYSAGPRVVLLTSDRALAEYGVIADRIGNAHNMYLEMLGGIGFVGAATWLALSIWSGKRMFGHRGREAIPVRVLFSVILLFGLTSSSPVLPMTQSSALLWILMATSTRLGHSETTTSSQLLSAARR
jgi:O-antigen ligase